MLNRFAFFCLLVILASCGVTKREAATQFERISLGESVRLGTLYDARTNLLYNGMELFDDLTGGKTSQEHVTDDNGNIGSLEEVWIYDKDAKTRGESFKVKASLQIDYMSGAIKVKGSAEYLTDDLEKNNTVRWTNIRTFESHFEDINLYAVGQPNQAYCDMMDQNSGPTHFVSRILYGQRATMTFDKDCADIKDKSTIKGELEITVKNIPNVEISGKGAVDIHGNKVEIDDSISVKFFGDAMLDEIPTTYEQAITSYKDTLIKREDDGTLSNVKYVNPLRYTLTPMERMCADKASVAINQIAEDKIDSAITGLINLKEYIQTVNYLMETDPATRFTAVRLPLVTFKTALEKYYSNIAAQFATMIPKIRAGGDPTEFNDLVDTLNTTSVFEPYRTQEFLTHRYREIHAIEVTHQNIGVKGVILSDPVSANDNECIFKHQNVTSFTINMLPNSDIATTFLQSTGTWTEDKSATWIFDDHFVNSIGDQAGEFSEYVEANMKRLGDDSDVNCYMVKLAPLKKGHEFERQLYQDGKMLTDNFVTPDQYDSPECGTSYADGFDLLVYDPDLNSDVSGLKVTIEWPKSADGDVLTSKRSTDDDEDAKDVWTIEQIVERSDIHPMGLGDDRETFRVKGLKPDTQYSLSVTPIIRHGHGEGARSDSVTCKTLEASSPAFLEVYHPDLDRLTATWSDPLLMSSALEKNYIRYRVSYGGETYDNQQSPIDLYNLSPLTRYTITVKMMPSTGNSETASLDFITAPNPPSWYKTEETSTSATFSVALDSLALTEDQSLESIFLKFSKVVDGSLTGNQEYWHQAQETISIQDLEQDTQYAFSFRITVRMDGTLHYSGQSDVIYVQTLKRSTDAETSTRNALDNLAAKSVVIDEVNAELDEVSETVDELKEFNRSDVISDAIADFDSGVTVFFTNFEQTAGALERSNCIQDGLTYFGDDWGHDGTFELGITSASSLMDCVDQCGRTEKCQTASLYQDPKEDAGECHLNEKRILEQMNFMFSKKNSRAVNLHCYDSTLTNLDDWQRCVMPGTTYKTVYSSYLNQAKTGNYFRSLVDCVAYCRMLPGCLGVTYSPFENEACYPFSKDLVTGDGSSHGTASSVSLACLESGIVPEQRDTSLIDATADTYKCYNYTTEDRAWQQERYADLPTPKDKKMCERHNGYIYTQGNDSSYGTQGCNGCHCCAPL